MARRFGVKEASLYSHIKNAHDLKTQVALLALAELADEVAAAIAGRAGKDALVAFLARTGAMRSGIRADTRRLGWSWTLRRRSRARRDGTRR